MQSLSKFSRFSRFQSKRLSLSGVATILVGFLALNTGCKSELDNKTKAVVSDALAKPTADKKDESEKETAKSLALDTSASKLQFVGAKVTGDHKGEFKTISGKVSLQDKIVEGLEVIVETGSVQADDDKLTSHLKSPDFFDTEKFPKAVFKSTNIEAKPAGDATHMVTGNLELHGKTKSISFPASITIDGQKAKGKAEFKINRKDFGIEYPGKPDDLIKDEVLLKLDLSFS